MRLGLLGPLLVTDDAGTDVVIPHGRLRALLAALLTRANQPVGPDELVELVWDGAPTPDAGRTVRVYLGRLRRALGPTVGARIRTEGHGYQCDLGEAELDLTHFEQLCVLARSAAADAAWPRAAALFADALALWRGAPLVDIPSDLLRARELPRLEQLRIQAVEDHIDAQVRCGRHEHLIAQLRDLTTQFPLRERLHAHLMRALAGVGRRAEALDAYRTARSVLVEQLGIEPGPELRRLQERILDGDTALLAPRAPSAPGSLGTVAIVEAPPPRQLPPSIRHFVGRSAELSALTALLTAQTDVGGAAVIAALDGTAGVGKTALAVHWAHQHADRFPDGQLYADLRGAGPYDPPLPPSAAVHGFLTALGVPPRQIPLDQDEQAALYRSHLAARRMLVLLDDARDADQVRPLLPGSPGSLVLVTSRERLTGLVALDGAVPITLDALDEAEARELLRQRLGVERLDAERVEAGQAGAERRGPGHYRAERLGPRQIDSEQPGARPDARVSELIHLCAGLPLALNIVAACAIEQPERPLSEFVGELREARRKLDVLTAGGAGGSSGAGAMSAAGEPVTHQRAVALWCVRTLASDASWVFPALGVPALALPSASALPDSDSDPQGPPGPTPAVNGDPDPDLAHSSDSDRPHTDPTDQPPDRPAGAPSAAFAAPALARLPAPAPHTQPHLPPAVLDVAWSEAEYANVVAAWLAALATADRLTDPAARIRARRLIGHAYAEMGRHDEAVTHLNQALALIADHPDPLEQAHTHRQLARAWDGRRDNRRALHHATRALRLYRAVGQPIWEAYALNQVAWYAAHLGHPAPARTHCLAALSLHRRHNNLDGEANTLDTLAYIEHTTGNHHRATDYYERALSRYQTLGNTTHTPDILNDLAHVHTAAGHPDRAHKAWLEALALYREQGRTLDADRVQRQLDGVADERL